MDCKSSGTDWRSLSGYLVYKNGGGTFSVPDFFINHMLAYKFVYDLTQ